MFLSSWSGLARLWKAVANMLAALTVRGGRLLGALATLDARRVNVLQTGEKIGLGSIVEGRYLKADVLKADVA